MNDAVVPASTVSIGRYRLDPLSEFEGARMPPAAMFTKTDQRHLAALLERVPPTSYDRSSDRLLTSVHSWVVRDDAGLVMLVDTCFGNLKPRPPTHLAFHMQVNDWLERLADLGVQPEDVTHVVNTHLHLDHVGWNTALVDGHWQPVFTNARHLMPRVELDLHMTGSVYNPAWLDSILPVVESGLCDPVDPGHRIASGIRLIPCPGHSAGQLLVEIEGGASGVIAGGDPLHHPLQVYDPNVNTGYCEVPAQSAASRRLLLERCAGDGWAIAAAHLLAPRLLRVRRSHGGFALAA